MTSIIWSFEGVTGTSILKSDGATGTITLPISNDTLVARNTVDTLTNKTFINSILSGSIKATNIIMDKGVNDDFQYDWDDATNGWTDIPINITTRGSGVNNPAWSQFRNGLYGYEFVGTPDNATREAWGEIHIPHQLTPGTGIYFHVHWAPIAVNPTGNIKWSFEYSYANSGSVFPTTQTVSVIQAMPSQYTHTITEIASPVLTGQLEVDGLCLVRVFRNPADPQDTSTDSAILFFVDCHINISKWSTKYRNKLIGGSFYG